MVLAFRKDTQQYRFRGPDYNENVDSTWSGLRSMDEYQDGETSEEVDSIYAWLQNSELRSALQKAHQPVATPSISAAPHAPAAHPNSAAPHKLADSRNPHAIYARTSFTRRAGAGSGGGSSSAPTTAPTTPAPTTTAPTSAPTLFADSNTAGEVISQTVTFEDLTEASWTATTQSAYEYAYGTSLGIADCTSGTCSYTEGCSVSASATFRRTASVAFTASVPTTASSSLTSTSTTPTSFTTSLSSVISSASSAYSSVSVPSSSTVITGSATVTYYSGTSTSGGDDDLTYVIIGCVIGAVVVAAVVVVIFALVQCGKIGSGPKGALGEPLANDRSSVELSRVGINDEEEYSPVHRENQRV